MESQNTLAHLLNRVMRLVETQGANAPCAAFIFTNEDVFTWENDGADQVPVNPEVAASILNEVEDCDYIYTQVFDMIDDELRSRGLLTE